MIPVESREYVDLSRPPNRPPTPVVLLNPTDPKRKVQKSVEYEELLYYKVSWQRSSTSVTKSETNKV